MPRIALVVTLAAMSHAAAQTVDRQGGWSGLMLSPFGAFPPSVMSADGSGPQTDAALRFGQWRYDGDDAPHVNVGLTLRHRLGSRNARLSVTGALMSVQCGTCADWVIGGAGLEATLLSRRVRQSSAASLGIQAELGGARNFDVATSRALSLAVGVPVSAGRAFGRSRLDVHVVPGVGYGRITGNQRSDGSIRPALGGGVAYRLPSGLGIELGIQRIQLVGAPAQFGVGLSWGPESVAPTRGSP